MDDRILAIGGCWASQCIRARGSAGIGIRADNECVDFVRRRQGQGDFAISLVRILQAMERGSPVSEWRVSRLWFLRYVKILQSQIVARPGPEILEIDRNLLGHQQFPLGL